MFDINLHPNWMPKIYYRENIKDLYGNESSYFEVLFNEKYPFDYFIERSKKQFEGDIKSGLVSKTEQQKFAFYIKRLIQWKIKFDEFISIHPDYMRTHIMHIHNNLYDVVHNPSCKQIFCNWFDESLSLSLTPK